MLVRVRKLSFAIDGNDVIKEEPSKLEAKLKLTGEWFRPKTNDPFKAAAIAVMELAEASDEFKLAGLKAGFHARNKFPGRSRFAASGRGEPVRFRHGEVDRSSSVFGQELFVVETIRLVSRFLFSLIVGSLADSRCSIALTTSPLQPCSTRSSTDFF